MKDYDEAKREATLFAQHHFVESGQQESAVMGWVEGYRQAMKDLGAQLGLPPAGGWKK